MTAIGEDKFYCANQHHYIIICPKIKKICPYQIVCSRTAHTKKMQANMAVSSVVLSDPNLPTYFSGDRSQFKGFCESCKLYFSLASRSSSSETQKVLLKFSCKETQS